MNNKTLIKFEKVFAYIYCVLAFVPMLLIFIHWIRFVFNYADYSSAYIKQETNVIIQEVFFFVACGLIFGISLWRLNKPSKILRLIVDVLYLFLIIVIFKFLFIGRYTT